MPSRISLATNETDIRRSFAVLKQLRPHLEETAMVAQIVRQQAVGYLLAYVESEQVVRAVAFCDLARKCRLFGNTKA